MLSAPKGTKTAGKVSDVGDGSYNVEFTPTDIGQILTHTYTVYFIYESYIRMTLCHWGEILIRYTVVGKTIDGPTFISQ